MDTEQGAILSSELPPDHRSGFIALIGKPNVGKSTLLNAWLGERIAAVSAKPQTTRTRLLGILTQADAQAVFVDTPGIHQPRTKLGEYMVKVAQDAIPDADVVLFLVDVSEPPSQADVAISQRLRRRLEAPVILVMNKADLPTPEKLAAHRAAYEALGHFAGAECISALRGENLDRLLEMVLARLPLGPRYYPEDQVTDQQERFIAAELIREQALGLLQQEVPHALAVVVEEFKERPSDVLYIAATIYTERESQKGIVIGRGGSMLKQIGSKAREALEPLFGRKVYLELWVKVRKDWRRDERFLREAGLAAR